MATQEEFNQAVEKSTRLPVSFIQRASLDLLRRIFETRNKKPMDFSPVLPEPPSQRELNTKVDEIIRG